MMTSHGQTVLLHTLLFFVLINFVAASVSSHKSSHHVFENSRHYKRHNTSVAQNVSSIQNFSTSALTQAQKIVAEAARQQGE